MGSRTTMETAIRILIFGASLQAEAGPLGLEFTDRAGRKVELPFFYKEERVTDYLLRHSVDAYIVDASGDNVVRRLNEYEGVTHGYMIDDPKLLAATIRKIIDARPRRPARRAA